MGKINVDYDVLNQKGSPAWYSDLFANIPTPGYTGRMFISTDTFAFYRDNGTGWDLTGGPGIGTITGSGVSGQVSFFSGTQVLGGSTNLIWDNTNNRLGIGVASPTVTLEISGSVKATALVKSGGTSAQILLADGTTTPTSTFQAAITLTTTGTTGASTLVGATLNVPTYTFVSSVSALTLGTSGTDLTSTVANSTTTPTITLNVPTASATNRGALSSADWTTFNNKQATITLTTTGTSGAATLVGATLNVPNYTNVGTVTSVAALTLGTSGTDLSSSVANSTSTPVITLNVPTASATNRGALSSADWTTFNNKQATISVTAPVVLTGATISMPAATTSVNGYLTSTDWNTFNNKSNTNGTVTSVVALTIGTSGIDITSTAVTTTTTPVITLNIPTASASNRGALSSTDWTTFNNKQATLSLTTTGTSGAATLVANTLNVPNYGSALSGYLPLSGGTLTGALSGTTASFSSTIQGTILTATSYFKSDTYRDSRTETLISYQGSNNIRLGSGVGADYLTFLAGGTLKATLDVSGNLGIGTSTPSAILDVRKATASGDTQFNFANSQNSSSGNTSITSSIYLGFYDDSSGLANVNKIVSGKSGDYTSAPTANSFLAFYTTAANSCTEKMRITSGGNVGIGVNPTTTTFQVQGAVNNNLAFFNNTSSNGYASARFFNDTNIEGVFGVGGSTSGSPYANNCYIYTGASTDLVCVIGTTEKFRIASSGAATFTSTLGINGTSNNVRSGTYTPTLVAGTNCAATTAYPCQYMQVDKVVTVSGQVYGSATAVTSETQFTMSVPVGSNFTQVYQCGGTGRSAQGGVAPSGAGYVAFIQAVSTDTVRFSYTAPAVLGTGGNFWFSFTYQII